MGRWRREIWNEAEVFIDQVQKLEGDELNQAVAEAYGEPGNYATDMGDAWKLREWITKYEGRYPWDTCLSYFNGPTFKDSSRYITEYGWVVGTEVWYCKFDAGIGPYQYFFHETLPATTLSKAFLAIHWMVKNFDRIRKANLGTPDYD